MTVPKVEDKDHQPGQAAAVETGTDPLEHQRDLITKLHKKPLVKGDRWYVPSSTRNVVLGTFYRYIPVDVLLRLKTTMTVDSLSPSV